MGSILATERPAQVAVESEQVKKCRQFRTAGPDVVDGFAIGCMDDKQESAAQGERTRTHRLAEPKRARPQCADLANNEE